VSLCFNLLRYIEEFLNTKYNSPNARPRKYYHMSDWTIFSNHGHVLVCLAGDPEARLRDVAAQVGLTERAVQTIVRDLQHSGMISISKHGRRNRYRIENKKTLRHDLEAHCTVGALVNLIINTPAVAIQTVKPAVIKPASPPKSSATDTDVNAGIKKDTGTDTAAKPDSKSPTERQQGSLF